MKKIYSHHDRFMVWQAKNRLDEKGIPCFIKNEFSSGGVGELSPLDSQPEVWITDDEWQSKAEQLVADLDAPPLGQKWHCGRCGEQNDGSFELCWQCGQDPLQPLK
jgi:hypothetical protein